MLEIPESADLSGTPKRVAELDKVSNVLPQEPSVASWRLVDSRPVPRSRSRRLDVESLVRRGFVRGRLLHAHERPPTRSEMRNDPAWEQVRNPGLRPRATSSCDDPALWKLLHCLHGDEKMHLECLTQLQERALDCPRLPQLVATELLSARCAMESALNCAPLLSAWLAFGSRKEQRVLAGFLRNTTALFLPNEAILGVISQRRPGAVLLTALSEMLERSMAETRSLNVSKGGQHDWAFVRLLQPAGSAVYHARHGLGGAPSARPRTLRAALAAPAARITAILADELHGAMLDDGKIAAHHEGAWADAQHMWETKIPLHEREALAAEQASVHTHEGLHWELAAGRIGEHEAASRAVLQRELLYRRAHYDERVEREHNSRLSVLIGAAGNLGLAPARDGSDHLLANVSSCHAHRSQAVTRAAATALRHHPHPRAEAALLDVMRRPPSAAHREARTAALGAITRWANVSEETVGHALDELRRTPNRDVRACLRACRANRNPHLYHYGEQRIECRESCEHETRHALGLIKLVEHAAAQGHDLQPHADAILVDTVSEAIGEHLGSSALGNTTSLSGRRLGKVGAVWGMLPKGIQTKVKSAALGAATTMICYLGHIVPVFQQLCQGIEIMLGFSPIAKRKAWDLVDLPLLGPVGFEMNLELANRIWARLGIFDGGLGIHIVNEAKAELYFGPVRVSLIHAQLKFKFVFTYCNVCAYSMLMYMIEGAIDSLETAWNGLKNGFDNDPATCFGLCPNSRKGAGRRLFALPDPMDLMDLLPKPEPNVRTEPTLPALQPPPLENALETFMSDVVSLELSDKLTESAAMGPPSTSLATPLTEFVNENAGLASEIKELLQEAATDHPAFLGYTAPRVASAHAAAVVAAHPQAVQLLLTERDGAVALVDSLSRYTRGLLPDATVADGSGPLQRTLDLIKEAQAPVDALASRLAEAAGELERGALFARWLHAFADGDQPGGVRPAPQHQASILLDSAGRLESVLDRTRTEIARGAAGLMSELSAPDICPADGSAVARAAFLAHGGHFDTLCCEVRHALAETAVALGAPSFGKLHRFLEALAGRKWAEAAAQFARQTAFCAEDGARCSRLEGAIRAGCAEPSHWAVAPSLVNTLSAINPRVVSSDGASASQVVLAFEAHLQLSGTMRCGGQSVAVEFSFVQPDAQVPPFASSSCPRPLPLPLCSRPLSRVPTRVSCLLADELHHEDGRRRKRRCDGGRLSDAARQRWGCAPAHPPHPAVCLPSLVECARATRRPRGAAALDPPGRHAGDVRSRGRRRRVGRALGSARRQPQRGPSGPA